MRILAAACLMSCLALPLSHAASQDGGEQELAYSFDNGDGLSGSSIHYRFNSRHGDFYAENGTPVSRYFVHRRLGDTVLHYGGMVSEDEHHQYGGVSIGPATLAYFQARADTFSKASNPLYDDLNQYFFHGGSRSEFTFQGGGADVRLGKGLSSQFAVTAVSAPGVEKRRGYYTGLAGRYWEGGVFQVDRGGGEVGRGLRFGVSGRNLGLAYQDIRSDYGAQVRRLALEWRGSASRSFAVELEEARNDLFPDGDEQRIMFRFRRSLGGSPAFSAAGDDNQDAGEQQPGFGRAVGIGVGVGVAAVALSSGNGDKDEAPRFSARNDAAFTVLNQINPVSVRQNIEHGGWIYRAADNTFGYTNAVPGTVNSVNIGNPATTVPGGTSASASYHTHGGPDPRFDNENFSPQDLISDRRAGVDGYLGTPAGFMKLHDRETSSITVIGRIRN